MTVQRGFASTQFPTQVLTPFPKVNAVARDLLRSQQANLGAQLIGMYLVGSLALGDFQSKTSDLDFIIVTDGALADEKVVALRELHQRFDESASPWAKRLDVVYILEDALSRMRCVTRRQLTPDIPFWSGISGASRSSLWRAVGRSNATHCVSVAS